MCGGERKKDILCVVYFFTGVHVYVYGGQNSALEIFLLGLAFYVHAGDMISGLHACVPGTLWTLPTPQAW